MKRPVLAQALMPGIIEYKYKLKFKGIHPLTISYLVIRS
jgi:hypothetical protein